MLVDTNAAMPTPTRAGKSNTISCEHQVKEATYIDLSLLSYFDSATRKTIPSVVDLRLQKGSSLLRTYIEARFRFAKLTRLLSSS